MIVNMISASFDTSKPIPDYIVLDKTPFYAEAGGQVSDIGKIVGNNFEFEVQNVKKQGDVILHIGKTTKGKLTLEQNVKAIVDIDRRRSIMRNHTATHLLHKALRDTLGEHVHQAGSMVAPERLRFDFNHFKAMDEAEVEKVEHLVNQRVWENRSVRSVQITFEEAKKMGAMALFGEKYGDVVRMVDVEGYSRELCGGTHVDATGEIGLFKILSETGIAAGMRRIEAVTGEYAYRLVNKQKELLENLSNPGLGREALTALAIELNKKLTIPFSCFVFNLKCLIIKISLTI